MDFQSLQGEACDCHMHLFDRSYPVIPNASLNPPPASLADYRRVQKALGCRRFVIVQPSVYGLDNSLLLTALRDVGAHRARGVAVVTDGVSDAGLSDLYSAGVRGVRFNQVQNGVTRLDMLEQLDGRLNERGMHVQFHAQPRLLIDSEQLLSSLRSPVVIDHIGRFASMPEQRSRAETTLMRLLDSGRVWLKLSGPYLASIAGEPYDDIAPFLAELMTSFPQRLLWGTDWPHATEEGKQNDVAIAAFFQKLMPSSEIEKRVFICNPEELYGFSK